MTDQNKGGLDFVVGMHYGRPYDHKAISTAVGYLATILRFSDVRAYLLDLPIGQASYSRMSETARGLGQPLQVGTLDNRLGEFLASFVLDRLEVSLPERNRSVRIMPLIHEDETLTVEVSFNLHPREETQGVRELLARTWTEALLLRCLDRVDPPWASVGVDPDVPSLSELQEGVAQLPSECGYFGRDLVSYIGRERLQERLRQCPKVAFLPCGGAFFSWTWVSSRELEGLPFQAFLRFLKSVRLDHIPSQGETAPT